MLASATHDMTFNQFKDQCTVCLSSERKYGDLINNKVMSIVGQNNPEPNASPHKLCVVLDVISDDCGDIFRVVMQLCCVIEVSKL